MKYVSLLLSAAAFLFSATMHAQNPVPSGFLKAVVELNKGTVLSGYAKNNIKKSSAVIFIDSAGNKKVYYGTDISTLTIDTVQFICIRGDFFKVICSGKIDFLQKAGNAAANPTYNGTEAMFINGTEGKPGDYFVYTDKKLQLLNNKNLDAFINTGLAACTEAMQKAKASNGDISKMGAAVETFNNYAVK